jgi:predicted TIM-barrel fold metal-dependent hydrolase
MGVPKGIKDDKVGPAMAPTLELARFPNVFVKLTNIPTYSTQDYPFPALFPALKQLIETFGPRRCLWGTNLSSMLHHGKCTYPQAVTMFTEEMDFLSREDLEWVMGRALAECLPWPVAPELASKKKAA